jgi:hypothetical protein
MNPASARDEERSWCAPERFFRTRFVTKDRINDTLKSFEKLRASLERRLR